MPQISNLSELVLKGAQTAPDAPLFLTKSGIEFYPTSYQEAWEKIKNLASWIQTLGLNKQDNCIILSSNRLEWAIADMAIMGSGFVTVPIYPTLSEEETQYLVQDSKAKLIFIEDGSQYEKIKQFHESKENPIHVVSFSFVLDAIPRFEKLVRNPWGEFDLEKQLHQTNEEDLASIIYTSGTTGKPKGVMLTHKNFLSNIEGIQAALELPQKVRVLSFLPLSHALERTAGYYTVLSMMGSIAYAESIHTVSEDIQLVKPQVVVSVPRLYEKIYDKVESNLTGVKKILFKTAFAIGKAVKANPNFILKGLHLIGKKIVLDKIVQKTGGQISFFVSGGAPLRADIAAFFYVLDLLILEGYGLTETAPVVSCNRHEAFQFGTVGKALPNVEVKIAEHGELCVKGPSVMKGYFGLPEQTKEAIDENGWFHTGDIAEIDANGFITIVDRIKELMVLSNGKKVAPLKVESTVLALPVIHQCMITGEKRNFVSAIIVPDFFVLKNRVPILKELSNNEICNHQEAISFIEKELEKIQLPLARYEKIKKFQLISTEFSQENGELTPSLKPKRKIIKAHYQTEIDALYEKERTT